ncbi:MAG: FHA domain-containing protein [Gammaproteobacteria bacterium]
MLRRLFHRPIKLTVNDETLTFDSTADFEFALAGRTNVPSSKLADLLALSPKELKREAKSIKAVEQNFVDILARSIEQPGEIGRLVRDLDPQIFSNDYDWRAIFKAINQQGSDSDELRRIAVVKYMQYLRSRQDVIKQSYGLKTTATRPEEPQSAAPPASTEEAEENPLERTHDIFRETSLFEVEHIDQIIAARSARFARLPKGEAVEIDTRGVDAFEVRLSKHRFRLVIDDPTRLIEPEGDSHNLEEGKNVIGRDGACSISVDLGLRDVSRLHLMIERLPDRLILTDLSSHGTFIPSQFLPQEPE